MFKIQDGRDKFYQWDLNRKLIVEDSSITQVHFSNAIYTTALVCEVIDGIVNVPNIILQDEFDIYVYGYDRDYTKHSATFNVVKRTKPESYVYTETEILNYQVLLDRINAVDLSNYYTILESNEKFATKEEIPSTTGFATESYVDNAVANVKIDLTGYATENYVDNKVAAIPKPDLSGYALKSELPDTSGFITEVPAEYVTETELESKGYLTEHQSLEGYATEEYVDSAIANIPSSGGGSGGSVAVDGTTIIQNKDGTISTAVGGSKKIVSEEEIVWAYQDDIGATRAEENTARIDLPIDNPYTYIDIVKNDLQTEYEVECHIYDNMTQTTEILKIPVKYDENSGTSTYMEFFFKDNKYFSSNSRLRFYGDITVNGQYFAWIYNITDNFIYNRHFVRRFVFKKSTKYSYDKLDARFIPLGSGLQLDISHNLTTSSPNLKGDKMSNYLIMDSNDRADISNRECVALGTGNSVGGQGSIALGRSNHQYQEHSIQYTIGDNNQTHCWGSYAFGCNNNVGENFNSNTMALGYQLQCCSSYSVAIGYNNIADQDGNYALIVGNGQSSASNGFTLDWSGNGVFGGQVGSTGSDYAEYFEWADGNPEAEDRVGYLVALDGDKIRLATPGDEILGIVSGTVAVLGDNYEWQWQGKYLTDDYGRVIYDMVDKYEEYEGKQIYMGRFPEPRINPDWDETATYIPRAKRKEWDAVGLLGKLYVRDDGTCEPNDYITVGVDGIATVSAEKTNIRVMSRKTDNIIRVYIK